ncbi:MAG TPA: ABC transporter ATP-binding protein [Oligoflexia bacterium]|nr:ABC transporter ATP-binding protein [Oligoflexia bacterium]HMP48036.1 ABC transporter ATP-binding protein [Oligoflexia bacterium]
MNRGNFITNQAYLCYRFFSILRNVSPGLALLLPFVIALVGSTVYFQSYVISWMVKTVYDVGNGVSGIGFVAVLCMLLVAILLQGLAKLQKFLSSSAEWHFRSEFETLTPKIYASLGLDAYAEDGPTAKGLARADEAVYDARFFLPQMFESLVAVGSACIGLTIIISISWATALILIIPVAISSLIQVRSAIRFIESERLDWSNQASITNVRRSFSSFHNFVAFRAFGMTEFLLAFIIKLANGIRDTRIILLKKELGGNLIAQAILFPAMCFALWHPYHGLVDGSMTPQTFVFLSLSLLGFTREVSGATNVIAKQILVADRMLLLLKVFDTKKPATRNENHSTTEKRTSITLVAKDLEFAYPGREPLFSTLNAEINLPIISYLVGGNGVGKSTMLALLTGIFEPSRGFIKILDSNGSKRALLVPQNGIKLDLPVRDVILASSRLDVPDEEIIPVLESAGVWDELKKQKGLDTRLGMRGGLSGGQEQRVFLALGLACLHFREENIGAIVLDEPFNHLSPDGVMRTVRNFEEAARNHNVPLIIVSHSKQLIGEDSPIIFMYREDGQPGISSGTHGELLESSSSYNDYWKIST